MLLRSRGLLVATFVLVTVFSVRPAQAQVALVRDGQAAAVIVLRADADEDQKVAAQELQTHVKLMTGAELAIRPAPEPAAGVTQVLIGAAAMDDALAQAIRQVNENEHTFALIVEQGQVRVGGLSSRAALIGVYELLEQLGVRWFMPGEIGTVRPASKQLTLKLQRTIQGPSFAGRWMNPVDVTWQKRMRMGGPYFSGAHGIPPFTGTSKQRQDMLEKEPECFALNATTGKRQIAQICVSNPRTLERTVEAVRQYFRKNPKAAAIGMGPNDSRGFCECDACKALDGGDWDAFANEPSYTDRYMTFYNRVLAAISDEFPDKRIHTYLYHSYIRPQMKVTLDRRISGALAPISLCRVHGAGNPVCPEKDYLRELTSAWNPKITELYDRGYWFNLADAGFVFPMVSRIRREIPLEHAWGLDGFRVEVMAHWASESPSLYIASKLMWNHAADVDALLADFYGKFYESAAEPMGAYHRLMDETVDRADYHTGSSFDLPHIFGPVMKQADALLSEAEKRATQGMVAKRVELARTSFDYLRAFLEMIESRNAHDYVTAFAALSRLDQLQERLIKGFEYPMINARSSPSYLKRFFRMPVEQGYQRTTAGNVMIAPLADRWQFQLDPQGIGATIGLQLPEHQGGNWQTLLTSSSSWSNQGLRYYKGQAWYRQSVTIPASAQGKRVFLWFGGVDEKAEVYLNGQKLGISPGSAFVPFEMDATPAIKAGAQNVLVVRVVNDRIDELGTGGLTAPVMFYVPAAGEQAQLQNVRGLSETFP